MRLLRPEVRIIKDRVLEATGRRTSPDWKNTWAARFLFGKLSECSAATTGVLYSRYEPIMLGYPPNNRIHANPILAAGKSHTENADVGDAQCIRTYSGAVRLAHQVSKGNASRTTPQACRIVIGGGIGTQSIWGVGSCKMIAYENPDLQK